jgi:Protein of unknown function (DUF3307)
MIETNVLFLLILKHFICDFPLQAFPYMYKNKGTYGHMGGIVHAGIHTFGTLLFLGLFGGGWWIIPAALFDGVIHYHIDWAKMSLGSVLDLKPDNSEWFWILLGLDQLLHYFTYFAIVWIWVA